MGKILDGKACAADAKEHIKEWIERDLQKPPVLAIFTIGDDDASKVYVRNKMKAAEEVGICAQHYIITETQYWQDEFVWDRIKNAIDEADGVILQKPVAYWFDEEAFLNYLPYWKDVDGLTPMNVGRLRTDAREALAPCTPSGIMHLLYENDLTQKRGNALVIGRSELVGRPIAEMLTAGDWTVTIAHSKTPRNVLLDAFARADLVISAAGKRNLITEEDAEQYFKDNRHYPIADFAFKKDRVIVDVSINRDENGKLCGDLSEEFKDKYSAYYTPVPGGVGPMTVAMLMFNTYAAARDRDYYESKEKKKELAE
jgi:methylenetetrahydrofolate dehydrogenase (NADP+)/methenyltetrahydrofolate cyclohydrolase